MTSNDGERHLSGAEEINVALGTTTTFNSSIQHADTKATVALTVLLGASATVAAQTKALAQIARAGGPLGWLVLATTGALLLGLVGSLWQVGGCLRPRLTGPGNGNRFAFADLAGVTEDLSRRAMTCPIPVDQLREQVWALNGVLADIALAKHSRLRRSVPWIAWTTLATIVLLIASGCGGS